jgi:CRP-like cAMP-binding protein
LQTRSGALDLRNATVRAATDVEVLEISRDGFRRLFRTKPETAATIANIAARRAAETNKIKTARDAQPASTAARVLAMMRTVFDFQR